MDPNLRPAAPDRLADLVAFVAGELPEDQALSVAAAVARDPSARREVEALRGTWDLLDLLPRPKAGDDFGSRTFSALRRVELVEETSANPRGIPRWQWLASGVAMLLTAPLGFVAMGRLLPDRGRRLAEHLTVAEHLDEYRDVGSIEFLHSLDKSPEFDEAE